MGARRASWRVLSSIEAKESEKAADDKVSKIKSYREKVEQELEDICNECVLLPGARAPECRRR